MKVLSETKLYFKSYLHTIIGLLLVIIPLLSIQFVLCSEIKKIENSLFFIFQAGKEGEIHFEKDKEIPFKIYYENEKFLVDISSKKFITEKVSFGCDKDIEFEAISVNNPDISFYFSGKEFDSNISGIVVDNSGKEYSWEINLIKHTSKAFELNNSLGSLKAEGIKKHRKNPVYNWDYVLDYGSYYSSVVQSMQLKPKFNHYYEFPVKCYIKTNNSVWKDRVFESIERINKFFPITVINNEDEATIVVEIKQNMKSNKKKRHVLGRGGMSWKVFEEFNYYYNPRTRNYVQSKKPSKKYIKQKGMVHLEAKYLEGNINLAQSTVIHELFHALGIVGHSFDKRDIMYEVWTGKNNKVSERDLNTLWLLYNEW